MTGIGEVTASTYAIAITVYRPFAETLTQYPWPDVPPEEPHPID